MRLPAALTPRAVRATVGRWWARAPLRVKLVLGLLLLAVIALGGSGVASVITTRHYLTGRVDTQLRAVAAHPSAQIPVTGSSLPTSGGPGGGGGVDRLPSAFVLAVANSTGTFIYGPTSQLLDVNEPLPDLPHPTGVQSSQDGLLTFTIPAVRGDGQWRVLSSPVTLADGSAGTLLVAESLGDADGTVERMVTMLGIIDLVALLVVAAAGYLYIRANLRPLQRVEDTAAAIAGGDLTRRVAVVDQRTEIGQLSTALNAMLTEIETAFAQRAASEEQMRVSEAAARRSEQRMRRFVADASHELRTPLTSIRGFAELYRQGGDHDDASVHRMMGRIEGEASRMGLLVDDLLLLARLDQQRPLDRSPVDLLALVGDAVLDARVVAPDRTVGLDIGNADPPPIVTGDEAGLRQVLGNLVGNALRHTPAPAPVTVRLSTSTDTAVVQVVDAGPGIPPDEVERIFERFYRTDKARGRDDGGTGLGLSIVAALVAAHAGSVEVDSAPGRGSCFTVRLPLTGPTRRPAPLRLSPGDGDGGAGADPAPNGG